MQSTIKSAGKLLLHTEQTVTPLIAVAEARRFMRECLQAAGASENHADQHAEILVAADHRGVFSHGMNRLEMYVDDLLSNRCDGKVDPVVLKDSPATAWVDGKNTLGGVVGNFCMDLAIQKAKAVGIGFVAARNSNHYGIAGWYAMRALDQGLIGLSCTNTSPLVAPTRSKQAALGTNPISLTAPANNDSFVLDMATSAVAVGKLEIARRKGVEIPVGWVQDPDGNPITDPSSSLKTTLLPLGGLENTSGFKGYGLAAMVEVLTGVLAGAHFGTNIRSWTNPVGDADLGQCFMALNPEFFAPGFPDRMSELLNIFRNLDPIDPTKPVLASGDPEKAFTAKVDEEGGIHYLPNQMDTCEMLSKKLNVKPLQGTDK